MARMGEGPQKYKRVRHVHEPGDFHELTFSCYRGMALLANDARRRLLSEAIQRAMSRWQFRLVGFVFMPEHVHLLVLPGLHEPRIDGLLKAIKRPFAFRVKQLLEAARSSLLEELTIRERPGVNVFRFWQEGGGYDRNLRTPKTVLASLDYMHNNPVARGLCSRVVEWKWSSARFYVSDGQVVDEDLPTIHRIPAEFFDGTGR